MGQPKNRSGDQYDDYQAVFDVVACLQCVVPEVKHLRDLGAKTNQEKQERTVLKKVSPHFYPLMPICRPAVRKNARSRIHIIVLLHA